MTYRLSGTGAGSFNIGSTTGQLTTAEVLDYEMQSSYRVTVTATDSEGLTDTIAVTIDINDDVWEFHDGSSTTRSVEKNQPAGTEVGPPVSAGHVGRYRYIFKSGDYAEFNVGEFDGQLTTKSVLDYEQKSSYTFVLAIESGFTPPFSQIIWTEEDTITVTVNVEKETPKIIGIEEVSTPKEGTVYRKGERILINVVFSQKVEAVFWCIGRDEKCHYYPDLMISIGDQLRYAPYRIAEGAPHGGGTSGTNRLQFIYYVRANDQDFNGMSIEGLGEEQGRPIRIQSVTDKIAVDIDAYTWPAQLTGIGRCFCKTRAQLKSLGRFHIKPITIRITFSLSDNRSKIRSPY